MRRTFGLYPVLNLSKSVVERDVVDGDSPESRLPALAVHLRPLVFKCVYHPDHPGYAADGGQKIEKVRHPKLDRGDETAKDGADRDDEIYRDRVRMAARDELSVKNEVAGRPRREGGADDTHRSFGYRQGEKAQRQQRKGIKGYPLADAEDREPREERAPKPRERLGEPAVGVDVAAPEYKQQHKPDHTDLRGVVKALRRGEDDHRDHRPAHGEQQAAEPRYLVDLLEEDGKYPHPEGADGDRGEVREVIVFSVGKFNKGDARSEERKDEAYEKIEEAQIFALRRPLAESDAGRGDAGGDGNAQRAVRHPDAAESPRTYQRYIFQIVVLVAFKVFFKKLLYRDTDQCDHRDHDHRCPI